MAHDEHDLRRLDRLGRDFYGADAQTVALAMLGLHLVHRVDGALRMGRIVEVEAYLGPSDRAAHSARGRTPRTEVMFGPPGIAYVYLIYGLHHCFNVVTGPPGHGSAVLVRALEPIHGIDQRTQGPGLLSRALGITRACNGLDLCGERLFLCRLATPPARLRVVRRPRIGVDYAGAWAKRLLRFYIRDNPYVSRP